MYITYRLKNQTEVLPTDNELSSWIPYFKNIGITDELLRSSFSEAPFPDFKNLYLTCSAVNKESTLNFSKGISYKEPWQLYLLTSEKHFVDKALLIEEISTKHDNLKSNFLHYAALSGSADAINAVLDKHPDLARTVGDRKMNVLHYAALSGSAEAINAVLTKYKDLVDNNPCVALAYAAQSGSSEAIQAFLADEERLDLLRTKGNSVAKMVPFSAAWSGSGDAIKAILSKAPELASETNEHGSNILHYAARSGSIEAIKAVLTSTALLASGEDLYGENLLHYAASSGSTDAIDYVLKTFPELNMSTNKRGSTLLSLLIKSNPDAVKWLFKNHPKLTRKLWRQSLSERTTAERDKTTFYFKKAIQEVLEPLTNDGASLSPESAAFISEFLPEFFYCIETQEEETQANLYFHVINSGKLGNTVSEALTTKSPNLKKSLAFKAVLATNKVLDKALLLKLLKAAHEALPAGTSSPLLNELKLFSRNIQLMPGDSLTPEALRVLNLIIDDYSRKPIHQATKNIDCILISKLCSTQTIKLLRPTTISEGLDIQATNFKALIASIETDFNNLHLSGTTHTTMTRYIFPGIKHLIDYENNIIRHFTINHGELYLLNSDRSLPLHTDHAARGDVEGFRRSLHRFITNFIGAAHIAKHAGRLPEYFDRFGMYGCLEGRSAAALEFASSLSGLKTFESLMTKAFNEYYDYQKIMLGKEVSEIENLTCATEFIFKRYQSLPCHKDSLYTPDSKITKKGIRLYIENSQFYNDDTHEKTEILKWLDDKTSSLTRSMTSFFKPDALAIAKRDALISLRFAIANAGETPLATVVAQWKGSKSFDDQTNAALIGSHRTSYTWRKPGTPTATETLIAAIIAKSTPPTATSIKATAEADTTDAASATSAGTGILASGTAA